MMKPNTFLSPVKIIIEQGGIAKAGQYAALLGKKALVCIGGGSVKRAGYLDRLTASLQEAGLTCTLYEGIPSDPDIASVEKGVAVCVQNACDVVVAMGGGSVLDAAKAIGLVAACGGEIGAYEKTKPGKRMLPMLAIPTTAGTASEVTKYSIITDHAQKRKCVIAWDEILPDIALLDVELTTSLPKEVAAATGMDALTHAVESYVSDNASMTTRLFALQAVRLILENIHAASYNNKNLEAKEKMLVGQMYAGLAFSNTSTCLVHSMSRPLGGFYGIPHGEANAVLLATVQEYNLPACVREFADIARYVGIETDIRDDWGYADAFISRLYDTAANLPLRQTLAEMQVKEEDLRPMAESAYHSGSTFVNPRKPTVDEIVELYEKLM